MADKTLAKIAALLRKAETTDNTHEADAFLQAAQRLATLAEVDLAVARTHTAEKERRAVPTQRTIEIGEPKKRGLRTYVQLFIAIAHANSVQVDVATNSTRVFAYGFDTDIDTVEALYTSLVIQMVRACDAFLNSEEHRNERGLAIGENLAGQRVLVQRKVHGTTSRINFQQAFAQRVGQRLTVARADAQREAIAAEQPAPAGADTAAGHGVALVLRAKEVELTEHYKTHSNARGSWRGFQAPSTVSHTARAAGDRAGRAARLGGEKAIGGHRAAVTGGRS